MVFREHVAGKQRVDAAEDYDSGTEASGAHETARRDRERSRHVENCRDCARMVRLTENDGGLARPGETRRESLRRGRASSLHRKLAARVIHSGAPRQPSTHEDDETEREPSRLPRDRRDISRPHDSHETETLGENSRLVCNTAHKVLHGAPYGRTTLKNLHAVCLLQVADVSAAPI
ncbi:hypothetical protein FN846DRAFT_908704 [Sphaerosporella brunnea]|uniref:Uncharacterized protein n=1 Tax=Sphaerosporella brunnea TaxID=1250544 RepID=A0A5J5ESY1_9PEZI|nr:hypothetical protein FN846DRAFT_908704 [Sphaerosporella brunnea]